jgi:antitoxin ParD1/3/4
MNVTIPAAAEEFVRRKVESGEFGSADEVVREGLRLLQEQDQQWSAEANRKIDEGWTQAKDGPLRTPEQVRENLAACKEAWRAARGPE